MSRVFQLAAGAMFFAALAHCQSVGVFMDFDAAPNRTSLEVMKKEVAALLRPAGVALTWRLSSESRGVESFAGLVLLKFKGKCRAESWPTDLPPGRTRALASTEVAEGRVRPFSEVRCDALRQALSYLRPETTAIERQKALGLAMGRVVAHEMYHVLAGVTTHAAQGLSKAAESLQELISSRPTAFSAEATRAIRAGLR
jgi:hypothetical protein